MRKVVIRTLVAVVFYSAASSLIDLPVWKESLILLLAAVGGIIQWGEE